MTAKDIAQEAKGLVSMVNPSDVRKLEHKIKDYAREKCREQREICNEEFHKVGYYPGADDAIHNAPEPEFK